MYHATALKGPEAIGSASRCIIVNAWQAAASSSMLGETEMPDPNSAKVNRRQVRTYPALTLRPDEKTEINVHRFPTIVRYHKAVKIQRIVWNNGIEEIHKEDVRPGENYVRPAGTIHVLHNIDHEVLEFEKDEIQVPDDGENHSSEGEEDD
jgi:hypothetical protein